MSARPTLDPQYEAALEWLDHAAQEMNHARIELAANPDNDSIREWAAAAEARYDDALAVAQEWKPSSGPAGASKPPSGPHPTSRLRTSTPPGPLSSPDRLGGAPSTRLPYLDRQTRRPVFWVIFAVGVLLYLFAR